MNLAGTTGNNQGVVAQDAEVDSGFDLLYNPNGQWLFMRPATDTTGPSTINAWSGSTAAMGTWTFLVGTYDVNTGAMTLYVNGTSAGTATDPTPVASSGPLTIGGDRWAGHYSDPFDGQVADVQVYPRALPAGEVSALYGLGRGGGDVTPGR